ncbi:MAG: helix-turn-helix domain-containing protein [Proteobacteria bacterium]|jgi:CRP/FNR family nitrogen fixation transcriptional regulator|nr:helix-turn-helix domain-containing protein [Pseudomonadota bacterium]
MIETTGIPAGPAQTVDPDSLGFSGGQRIHDTGAEGTAWRVASGVVRFDLIEVSGGEPVFAGLAMGGDIVGAEVLLFGQFSYRATALTDCELAPWPGRTLADSDSLLRALTLANHRAARVVALRSGQAIERVGRLIRMLLPQAPAAPRTELPPLRDIAEITALTVETVSRILSGLRRQKVLEPEQQRRGRGRKSCRVSLDLLAAV